MHDASRPRPSPSPPPNPRIVASLKPGGTLLRLGYTPRQLVYRSCGPPHASHLCTGEMPRDAFASMTIDVLRSYEADVTEDTGHRGRSAPIGLVARR